MDWKIASLGRLALKRKNKKNNKPNRQGETYRGGGGGERTYIAILHRSVPLR